MYMNSWAQFIRSNKAIHIPFQSYHNVTFSNAADSPRIAIPKSYGRLCGVLVTMEKPPTYLGALGDNGDTRGGAVADGGRVLTKHVDQFYFSTGSKEEAKAFL